MKTRIAAWLLCGALATLAVAAEEPKEKPVPAMPTEVTLTSGRVLRNVSVVRWEKERVVLKYAGGVDPIHFSLIKSVARADLLAMRAADDARRAQLKIELAELEAIKRQAQAAREAAAEEERQLEEARERASRDGRLMAGQTYDQVRRVLGDSHRRNEYASGRETQEIYELDRGETWYVYYTAGRVTSWQRFSRRR